MKHFVTLFHGFIGNINCTKAEIQIPLNISKHTKDIDFSVYSVDAPGMYKGEEKLTHYESLPFHYFRNINIGGINLGILYFLIRNSKKIDFLHLIHFVKSSILYGLLYKWLNPKGKLYIMMDFDPYLHDIETVFATKYKRLNKFIYRFVDRFISKCNCISVETRTGYDFLVNYNIRFKENLIYMPNGFDKNLIDKIVPQKKSFSMKENIILTVGRVGSHQKNTEMLIESIKNIDLQNRKVYIVGPIEDGFQETIDTYFIESPHLKDKVIFTGPIYDKKELYNLYNRSKIFCLTSRYESFGIVLVEAMYLGNFVVTTNISSAGDITKNGELGTIIDHEDVKGLSLELQRIILRQDTISTKTEGIRNFVSKNFDWATLIEKIYNKVF